MRNLICTSIILLCMLSGIQSKSISRREKATYHESTGSDESWLKCHNFPCDQWAAAKTRLTYLKQLAVPSYLHLDLELKNKTSVDDDDDDESLDGCILLTPRQIEALIDATKSTNSTSDEQAGSDPNEEALEAQKFADARQKSNTASDQTGTGNHDISDVTLENHRVKRKLLSNPFSLWSMPITWKFDENYAEHDKDRVRSGFQHWMDHTCVKFKEIGSFEEFSDNHIAVTSMHEACYSFIGQIEAIPQQINLHSRCLEEFGKILHEIGHALGLFHEQQRADRDKYITINWENIDYDHLVDQFMKENTSSHDVPYDFGSVMHYAQNTGSRSHRITIQAKDPTMQSSMGQRVELSYGDAKIINEAYCKDSCSNTLVRPCQYGGYQDPLNCNQCRCPDGLTGTYCQDIVQDTKCGGSIRVSTSDTVPKVISSPGYYQPRYYSNGDRCSWRIKASAGENVRLQFSGQFAVYCHYARQCYHWVEVKHSNKQVKEGVQGSRFCCSTTPRDVLISDGDEMIVTFRSNWDTSVVRWRRGFTALVSAVPGQPSESTTKPTEPTITSSISSPGIQNNPSCEKLDIAFVLESAGSIKALNWKTMLELVKKTAFALHIGRDEDRLGVVSFGLKAYPNIRFTDFDDKEELQRAIGRIPYRDSWTNSSGAIKVAREELFGKSFRSDARKVMVLVVDGPSNRDRNKVNIEADAARNAGIDLYVIGVGGRVDNTEVNEITDGRSDALRVAEFGDLKRNKFIPQLFGHICPDSSTSASRAIIWRCSFEMATDPFCGSVQSRSDNFDWTRHTGRTRSSVTGPNSAQDGSFYIYIEASSPRKYGDEAILILPVIETEGTLCLTFGYHMYGYHINTLRLDITSSEGNKTAWSRQGRKGNQWLQGQVEINVQEGERLAFVGVRGREYSGDIALDDISLLLGECPAARNN